MSGTQKNVSDFVQKHFVSATNVSQFAQPKKHHVNNVSATMCPRLPGPIIQDKENAQEMYHGMSSPALGWSSGKKAQDIARHKNKIISPSPHSTPLLYTCMHHHLCLSRHAKH